MSKQDEPTPETSIPIETPKPIETGTEKPLDMPTHILHPRKIKHRPGKFDIAEGGEKFPKKPDE